MSAIKIPNPWFPRLEQQVQASLPTRRKTVSFEAVFMALMADYRTQANHPDTPQQLRAAIDELLHNGHWRAVPADRQRWPVGWRGLAVPRSLIYQVNKELERAPVAWHSFLAQRITGELSVSVETRLRQLNEYLMSRSRAGLPLFEDILGHRERALQVFGDEKTLESFPVDGWQNVDLTLKDLQCVRKAPPVPFEGVNGSIGPALVVENSDTYYTLCAVNRRTLQWRAVIYGSGNLATSQAEGIASLINSWHMKQVLYCGDLDVEGLYIANRLRRRLDALGITLSLDETLYQAMIDTGKEGEAGKANRSVANRDEELHLYWVSEPIRQAMRDLISRNKRIAQETLAFTPLMI